jgi:hypothetical protein
VSEGPTLERLAELEATVARRREAAREREAVAAQARRAGEREQAALNGYYEAVAAGEREADDGEHARLLDAAQRARASIAVRHRHGRNGEFLGVELVDERAEAELRGARRALEAAERELANFAVANRDRLHAELLPLSRDAADAHAAAVDALMAADGLVTARRSLHARVERFAGRHPQLGHAPEFIDGQALADYRRVRRDDPDSTVPAPLSNGRA